MNSTCSFPACENPVGYLKTMLCDSHRAQQLRGKPLAPLRKPQYICSVDGCGKPHNTRGYCRGHATRFYRTGDVNADIAIQEKRPGALCDVEGCENAHEAKGYCSTHKGRVARHGDPLAEIPIQVQYLDPEEAFAARTEWRGECLVWTGPLGPTGYGSIQQAPNRRARAHRYAWERVNGPIPGGMYMDHICWNRACVNVKHLRLATPAQNASYLSTTGRASERTPVRNVRRKGDRWEVRVGASDNYVGTFDTFEEAQNAAEHARADRFGEFAGRG